MQKEYFSMKAKWSQYTNAIWEATVLVHFTGGGTS
jgi:hypothetical protein